MSADNKPPDFSRRKLLWSVVLFAGMGLLGWSQLIRDEEVRMPEGFLVAPPETTIPPDENGLILLIREAGSFDSASLDLKWQEQRKILKHSLPWEQAVMQPMIDAAPAARDLLRRALSKSIWQETLPADQWIGENDLGGLHRIFLTKSMDLARQGHLLEALTWLTDDKEMAVRFLNGAAGFYRLKNPVDYLQEIQAMTFHLLATHPLSEEILSAAQELISSCGITPDQFQEITRRHYQDQITAPTEQSRGSKADPMKFLSMCCDEKRPPAWFIKTRYKQGAEQNLLTKLYTTAGQAVFCEGTEARDFLADLNAAMTAQQQLSFISLDPNRAGKIIAGGKVGDLLEFERQCFANEALRRCRLVAIAAKRWSLANSGQWPARLEDLMPGYLAKIPADPYDAEPLRWDAPTGTAFAIGEHGSPTMPVIPSGYYSVSRPEGSAARLP